MSTTTTTTTKLITKDPKIINLIKKNEHIIGFEDHSTKIFQRIPISSRKYREIEKLVKKSINIESYFDINKKLAEYCLEDFPIYDFDSTIWESATDLEEQKGIFGLKSILESCIYRAVYGIAYFRLPSRIGLSSRDHLVN